MRRFIVFILAALPVLAFILFMFFIYYNNPVDVTCSSFVSHADAVSYFHDHPKAVSLDRDRDGIPCEALH